MKILSRHSDTVKAFTYLLKEWDALNLYCSNGWVEIDSNIAENTLRGVALGRKNWLFAASNAGGERVAVLCSLICTCRLNGVEPEAWLRYVLGHIQEWPVNRLRDLLQWKSDLTFAYASIRPGCDTYDYSEINVLCLRLIPTPAASQNVF